MLPGRGVIAPRLLAIGAGALVGTVSSLIVWPENSSRRAERHLRDALRAITECLDSTVLTVSGSEADGGDAWSRYHFNIRQARSAAKSARFHKTKGLLDRLEHVERLYNSVLILNRVAEESTTAGTGAPDYRQSIDEIRRSACAVTDSLADGKDDRPEDLERVDKALSRALDAVMRRPSASESDRMLESALVFGLREVATNLHALLDAKESTAGIRASGRTAA